VIEDDDALGAAFGFHQRFHLRIVGAAHLGIVEKVDYLGVVRNEAEAFTLELKILGEGATVTQHDPVWVGLAAARICRSAGAGFGDDFLAGIDEVIQGRFDLRNGFR